MTSKKASNSKKKCNHDPIIPFVILGGVVVILAFILGVGIDGAKEKANAAMQNAENVDASFLGMRRELNDNNVCPSQLNIRLKWIEGNIATLVRKRN